MATGVTPFSGTTVALIFDGILHSTPAPVTKLNPKLPLALENIFAKALEKDTDLRYQTAARNARRLEAPASAISIPAATPAAARPRR